MKKAKKTKWVEIDDSKVRHIWQCTDKECDCDHKETGVSPTFYQDNGTPMCDGDEDMEYIKTIIRVDK